ncbi:Actin (Fragment) [Seminavis robusta]|uniref:Actin n=1 Tax=Seminavis robusta TaxID=568900 RepID=A0A9N8HH61_9STRA
MYCGDETGSFIGDIGSHTSRFGYGGEDNPKFVAPSYTVQCQDNNSTTSTCSSIPSSCYSGRLASQNVRPILRMPWLGEEDQQFAAPQIDPNAYLPQGDGVQDWDAHEQLWLRSLELLRVTDTLKHTKGGTPYTPNNVTSSSTIHSNTTNKTGARCVHPILAVTPGMTYRTGQVGEQYAAAVQREQHTKLVEFLMETVDAPACFLAPTPMLSAFCFGRQTALVVDVGAGGCRVTPVVDGLLLKHAQRRNGRGGDWLGNVQWRALLEQKVVLRPRYQLRNAISALATKSPYFYRWAMQDLLYEFRTSSNHCKLAQWCDDETVPFLWSTSNSGTENKNNNNAQSSDEEEDDDEEEEGDDAKKEGGIKPTPMETEEEEDDNDKKSDHDDDDTSKSVQAAGMTYELPDGTHIDLSSKMGHDLCRIPELLFTDEVPYVMHETSRTGIMSEHHTLSNLPLHQLVFSSLSAVGDGDLRKDLAANIILTGGSSLFPNMAERLSMEVPRVVPSNYKCRVIASRNSVERSCSAWVGASILTSLGSFQQLWLSRNEYQEYGAALAIQRFP